MPGYYTFSGFLPEAKIRIFFILSLNVLIKKL